MRSFSDNQINEFNWYLSQINWLILLKNLEDADKMYEEFFFEFSYIFEISFPKRKVCFQSSNNK